MNTQPLDIELPILQFRRETMTPELAQSLIGTFREKRDQADLTAREMRRGIAALEGYVRWARTNGTTGGNGSPPGPAQTGKHPLSAAGRRRIAAAQKKRHAQARKNGAKLTTIPVKKAA